MYKRKKRSVNVIGKEKKKEGEGTGVSLHVALRCISLSLSLFLEKRHMIFVRSETGMWSWPSRSSLITQSQWGEMQGNESKKRQMYDSRKNKNCMTFLRLYYYSNNDKIYLNSSFYFISRYLALPYSTEIRCMHGIYVHIHVPRPRQHWKRIDR